MGTVKFVRDFSVGDSFKIRVLHSPIIDLTDGFLVFALKKRETDTTTTLAITHTIGDDPLDDAANGLAYLPVRAADTIGLTPGRYFGTLKRLLGNDVFTIARSDREHFDLIEIFPDLTTSV